MAGGFFGTWKPEVEYVGDELSWDIACLDPPSKTDLRDLRTLSQPRSVFCFAISVIKRTLALISIYVNARPLPRRATPEAALHVRNALEYAKF